MATDVARYGPDIPSEAELKLCGNVEGKRVLELGTEVQSSIAFAKQGAHTVAVDSSPERLAELRRRADDREVKVELHESDLADLAFVRADSIDLAFSAYAFDGVEDLNRLFRQVHRVLRQDCPLVFSISHPAYAMIDDAAEDPLLVRRSYFERSADGEPPHRTISELFTGLTRANFRVDIILEPSPPTSGPRSTDWRDTFKYVPRTLIIRARKEGI
ncbi:MAG: class I SAM-dependent methyltransferase [Acidimicrobiia bacterium]|nr:class I SAM-dependent methyltransferase [Acidimicrobiia bacterium]